MREKWEKAFNRKFISYPGGVYVKKTNRPASFEDIKDFIIKEVVFNESK